MEHSSAPIIIELKITNELINHAYAHTFPPSQHPRPYSHLLPDADQ
jgi:hypothetical protein